MTDPAILSKGEYARLKGVSPGRVSQWIAAGQIGPEALDGVGRSAKIRVAIANEQLKQRLDINQRLGSNGLATNLSAGSTPSAAAPSPPAYTPPADPTEERIKQAKLAEIEFRNRKAAEAEAERQGRYTETVSARREMGKIASEMLKIFEGSLTDLATAIGARFEVPQRDVLHLMRTEFRAVRQRAAESLRRQADALPATIDDPIDGNPPDMPDMEETPGE